MKFAIPAWDIPAVPVAGSDQFYPVRHIYCVGRNYAEHAKEMGGDATKEPPFFFTKPADAIVPVVPPAIGDIHYPLATKNFHHEIELVVAIGARGVRLAPENANQADLRLRRRTGHDAARPAERDARNQASVGYRQIVCTGRTDRSDPSGERGRLCQSRAHFGRGEWDRQAAGRPRRHGLGCTAYAAFPVAVLRAPARRSGLYGDAGGRCRGC